MTNMTLFSFVFGALRGDVYSVSDVEGDIFIASSNEISRLEATAELKRKIFFQSLLG